MMEEPARILKSPTPTSPQQKVSSITPVQEKSNSRKANNRQQSITRGTASSRAKAVRPINTTPSTTTDNIQQRRMSLKTRKQSLNNMDTSRLLMMSSTGGNMIAQRRSSWSPFTPTMERRTTPSPSLLSPTITSHQEQSPTIDQSTSPLAKKAIDVAAAATTTNNASPNSDDRSIVNSSGKTGSSNTTNNNKKSDSTETTTSSSMSTSSSLSTRVHSSCSKKASPTNNTNKQQTVAAACFFKYEGGGNDYAASHANNNNNNQQKQMNNPLETPPPDDNDDNIAVILLDEVSNIRQCPDQQTMGHHHRHHNNNSEDDDSSLPGYMRRPICAACNRNVKVTSSSESLVLLQQPQQQKSSSNSNSSSSNTNNSRRSSISVNHSSTTNHMTKNKKRREDDIKMATVSTSLLSIASSNSSGSEDVMMRSSSRPHSPTSPIPSRRMEGRRKSNLQEISNDDEKEEDEVLSLFHSHRHEDNTDKWNQLLSQQQKILEFINKDPTSMITLPITKFNKKDETIILETQMELLKRLESLLLMSSPTIGTSQQTSTTTTATTTITTMTEQLQEPKLAISTSWQTKFEFSVTRFKWNMSQWIGTMVGTGHIEEQDFDIHGYTNNVVISGVCVTAEPGLLPKNLQKYYHPFLHHQNVICHKYMIHLSREKRLSSFALLNYQDWIKDENVDQCEFSVQEEDGRHKKRCSVEFGVLHRRHHCRSCGHVFCQTHSSNLLPLFVTNGEECGEWSRVCDLCFYARIDPQFISRS